jgi:AcrR family transcriptional regulator
MESDIAEPTRRKAVGRPRRLTLESIVDAACDIGIAQLEMSLLAERLNTGVATLYGYVRGREHLLELVTQRLAGQALVKDRGQIWQDIVREHAAVTFALFQSMPQLITNLIGGDPNLQSVQYAQFILGMLESRGLSKAIATDIYIEANQIVIGAAIFLIRRESIKAISVKQYGQSVVLPKTMGDYRPTLERIISSYETLLPECEKNAATL